MYVFHICNQGLQKCEEGYVGMVRPHSPKFPSILFTSLPRPLLSYPINILGLAVLRGKIKELNQCQNLSEIECEIMVLYETALGKDMIEEIHAIHNTSLLRL